MKYFVEMGNELREFRSEAECRGVIALNEKLNKSEKALRHTLPGSWVDLLVERFTVQAQADRALYDEFYRQSDPYGWLAMRHPIPQPGQPA
jgi:hypothetical protein